MNAPGLTADESLPFSIPKQEALLGHLLRDSRFFLMARPRIKEQWWANSRLSKLWGMAVRLSEGFSRPMTASELGECPEMAVMDQAERLQFQSVIARCISRSGEFGLDLLQSDLTDWFRCRVYLAGMKKSEGLFNAAARGGGRNSAQLKEAFEELRRVTRDIDEASFEFGQVESVRIEDIEAAKEDIKTAVNFGLEKLNSLLAPEGMGFVSLLRGDMTVLLAPTNVGKTTTMVTIAAINLLEERDVLLITHEGRIGDIKLKIWQCMMEDTRQRLMNRMYEPGYRAELKKIEELLEKHLEFMPLNKAGLTVEEVEVIIRRRQETWQTKHMGKGFDLVIDDYAAKLTTQQARGGQFALRQIHEVVYNYFSQIALEHNVHVVTAIQTNRDGSRVNSRTAKGAEARFLTMEDVMEAWGPMTTATNVVSINRPPEAQAKNVTGFYLAKSRSSKVGVVFLAQSKFECARSHWPGWQCEEFHISSTMGDRLESMLADFHDVTVPDQESLPEVVPTPAPQQATA